MLKNLKYYDSEVYRKERPDQTKVIAEGYWYDRHFVIGRNRLGFPVAYVEIKDREMDRNSYKVDEDLPASDVNGGFTYFGKAYWTHDDERLYAGWDYAHCYDYDPFLSDADNPFAKSLRYHKWTFVEILMHIAAASTALSNDYSYCEN